MPFEFAEKKRTIEILCDEWDEGTGTVDSEIVYDRLVSEGFDIPNHSMNTFWLQLKEVNGMISGPMAHDREGAETHGAMTITGVDEKLCNDYKD